MHSFQKLQFFLILIILSSLQVSAQYQSTPFERDTLSSATYDQVIDYYDRLASLNPWHSALHELGTSDSGQPLHVFFIGANPRDTASTETYQTLLINNGIHAGEPCGIDASMMLARDLLAGKLLPLDELKKVRIAIIPVYSVGGALNRNSTTRTNQEGPKEYGFRGNAQNLDLNRDFVKQDSRNARLLTQLMDRLSPDFFVDTHTTNGADYQYPMTLITSQPEKLGPVISDYLRKDLVPLLYDSMEQAGYPMVPYVYSQGVPQEAGINTFIDLPRYSTGFAALHHTIGFVTEAHMLKPYAQRVRATESFLHILINYWTANTAKLARIRETNKSVLQQRDSVTLAWALDDSRADTIDFLGYKAIREKSKLSGLERLRYDRNQPDQKPIPYRTYVKPSLTIDKPRAYIVPAAQFDLLEKLGPNVIADAELLPADTVLNLSAYRITNFDIASAPYEGHVMIKNLELEKSPFELTTHKNGYYYVPLNADNQRLLTASFEPLAPDSYVRWGFLNTYLQQKEYFSAYVFEELAIDLLRNDSRLRANFQAKRETDKDFRDNHHAQLDWIYKRSPHYEPVHLRYPIFREE